MASRTVSRNMPKNPTKSNVFLPAFSTNTKETRVIKTFIAPTPIVAFWAACLSSWAILNIFVEKNMTALMPDSCWANMTIIEMNIGMRSAGFTNSSRTVTFGTNFTDSYSARISSISSWTSIVPRNQDNAIGDKRKMIFVRKTQTKSSKRTSRTKDSNLWCINDGSKKAIHDFEDQIIFRNKFLSRYFFFYPPTFTSRILRHLL